MKKMLSIMLAGVLMLAVSGCNTDSSVDGVMKQFTSGVIATIQPGKTFNQGWNLGAIPNKEIEFSMSICGKDMSELVRTDSLKIEVK